MRKVHLSACRINHLMSDCSHTEYGQVLSVAEKIVYIFFYDRETWYSYRRYEALSYLLRMN